MHRSVRFLLAAVFAVAACSNDITGPTAAVVADDVVITATVPGSCRPGVACDPISPSYTLGLITVRNNGTAAAYLRTCGSTVRLTEQQLVNGQWQAVGPAITCAVGPVSIALAAGDSIQSNWWFAPGTRRLALGVAPTADLSGEALAASASFVVH